MAGDGFVLAGPAQEVLRPPAPQDAEADLTVFLGESADLDRTAYVLVARQGGVGSIGLRELARDLQPDLAAIVATSLALANWHWAHPRCSRCGEQTEAAQAGWTRRCPADESEHFPRTDIAVIMAVTDADDRLLLARAPAWPPGRMSILAGFLEPGETMAQAVAREVREEVGIAITDVELVADQPWPFPSSLMVGFTASALSADLVVDGIEIAEARWVRRDEVAALIAAGEYLPSPRFSISRALVEDWYGGPLPSRPAAQ